MPQIDRHKDRTVPIEFVPAEDFACLPYPGRRTLTLLTDGSVRGLLNGCPVSISAPGVLCLSERDCLKVCERQSVCAQSFCFPPDFLHTVPISSTRAFIPSLEIQTGRSLFEGEKPAGRIPPVTAKAFPQLFEWFFILGTEVSAQSDSRWVCRIKKYLIQILGMLEDLSRWEEPSPVDLALDYIHTNYPGKITVEDLTGCAHLNRVTLNSMFQERCGCTAIGYLLTHRLRVAEELLTHTGMSLEEIARATGFAYDTYFIKQFTAKRGMSPTTFRNRSRTLSSIP